MIQLISNIQFACQKLKLLFFEEVICIYAIDNQLFIIDKKISLLSLEMRFRFNFELSKRYKEDLFTTDSLISVQF